MRFYNQPHQFYCGIDLHARTLAAFEGAPQTAQSSGWQRRDGRPFDSCLVQPAG